MLPPSYAGGHLFWALRQMLGSGRVASPLVGCNPYLLALLAGSILLMPGNGLMAFPLSGMCIRGDAQWLGGNFIAAGRHRECLAAAIVSLLLCRQQLQAIFLTGDVLPRASFLGQVDFLLGGRVWPYWPSSLADVVLPTSSLR